MKWMLAAHRSELARPGDYVLLRGGFDHYAIFNLEGEVLATDNVCAHRGSRILLGTHGTRELACPYHGFKGKKVIGRQYMTAWLGDWLFLGDGETVLEDDLADLGPILYGISGKITRRHDFDFMPMPCDWTVAVENTLEDLHVSMVHPDTFGKLGLKLEGMSRHGLNSIASYKIGDERIVKAMEAIGQHVEDVQPDTYFHIHLYPFTCLSSVGGASFSLQHYLPAGGMTGFHSRLYAGKVKPGADLRWWFDEAVAFNKRVFAQDSAICATVADDGTFLTEHERRIVWFREAANSNGRQSSQDSKI